MGKTEIEIPHGWLAVAQVEDRGDYLRVDFGEDAEIQLPIENKGKLNPGEWVFVKLIELVEKRLEIVDTGEFKRLALIRTVIKKDVLSIMKENSEYLPVFRPDLEFAGYGDLSPFIERGSPQSN